jgi:sucrose-6-phosphate hydrolase SacC (GH32 family)
MALAVCPALLPAAQPDLVVADFEGGSYGAWQPVGAAFGHAPATGNHPRQSGVKGFLGKGLVNTRLPNDKTTGTLTSPPFKIERDYLRFRIGGGNYLETSLNLLVDGRVVRLATGNNQEALAPGCWDVKALRGRLAVLRIVDAKISPWGHLNVDQIEQSNDAQGIPQMLTSTTLVLNKPYLNFQLGAGNTPATRLWLKAGAGISWEMPVFKLDASQQISWNVASLQGQKVQILIDEPQQADGTLLTKQSLRQTDQPQGTVMVFDQRYAETWRPQFHFTAATNWLNDPNGLVYDQGEYHLFFQHNPYGVDWGHMSWGHAVSRDLFHWTQLEHALLPDELGTIFSGSAVIDEHNTGGFQTGSEKPLVVFYTNAGSEAPTTRTFSQSLAFSGDRGRTFTKYAHNPVVEHIADANRDPKVFWHEPSKQWVMALYLTKNDYTILTSTDLKKWTRHGTITMPGVTECPDLFELAVAGESAQKHWVFWGGNGTYLIGKFDGTVFTPESKPLPSEYAANCYAGQTWNNIPESDGRRIFIGWMRGGNYPGMPFNQQMSVPRVMTLRQTAAGLRLCMLPVREIEALRTATQSWSNLTLKENSENPLAKLSGDLFDFELKVKPAAEGQLTFNLRGEPLTYDGATGKLALLGKSVAVPLKDGVLTLRVLVDRTSIEVFANDGEFVMSSCFLPAPWVLNYALTSTAPAEILDLKAHTLRSAWPQEK